MYNKMASGQQGFTLIELLVVVAIIAIVLSLAAPSFNDFFAKNRLKRAAEEVYGLVTKARAETTIRDTDMAVTVDTDEWCLGYAAAAGCDCKLAAGAAGACSVLVSGTDVLQVVDASDFNGVALTDDFGGGVTFNSVRGTTGGGSVNLSAGGWELNIVVSNMGRVRVCAPADSTTTMGYDAC